MTSPGEYTPGPYPYPHGYIQWGGSLPGGEEWSCGLRFSETGGDTLNPDNDWDMEELLAHFVEKITTFHSDGQAHIGTSAKLQFVKFNKIKVDGRYQDLNSNTATFPDVAGGGGPANVHPNQCALVVTLLTDVQRGPGSKGRFYLPAPAVAVQPDGLISQGVADDVRTAARTLIEALSDVPGPDGLTPANVVVMSRKAGKPSARRVTGIQVGRVIDTQRRRRRSLPENYNPDVVLLGEA